MTLGEQLKNLRQQKGWTQPEAAEHIGIEQSYLSKLENDKSTPSADLFDSLLTGYQIDVAGLVEPLSPKQQNSLRNIPAVADYLKLVQQQQAKQNRGWLIGSLASFSAGILLLALGYFKVLAPGETYIYESKGITKQGESPRHFEDWTSQRHFLNDDAFKKLSKEIYQRKSPKSIVKDTFVGEFFIEEEGEGLRFYSYQGSHAAQDKISLLLMALGTTLTATALYCLFLARRWR